jgi:hypothetical protein
LLQPVLELKVDRVLLQVLLDLADLLGREESGRAGAPEELTKLLLAVLLQALSLECPEPVGVVHLNDTTSHSFLSRRKTKVSSVAMECTLNMMDKDKNDLLANSYDNNFLSIDRS